jgi:hypothetical protein
MNTPTSPGHYQTVLEDHKELKSLLDKVQAALASRCVPVTEAVDQLALLGDRLVTHFALEEDGGYFSEALLRSPQLVVRANGLMAQHPKLCTQVRDLASVPVSMPEDAWWAEASRRFAEFREELLRHERGEDILLQEAYVQDIGSHD